MRDIKTHPKLLLTTIILVVALAGGAGVVLAKKLSQEKPKSATTQRAIDTSQTDAKTKLTNSISYDGVEGKTALELLKTKATVVTKDSAYGPYVDSVNGVVGGTDGKYWAFYVNGAMAQVGANAYVTKAGDKIQWKFE